MEDLERFVQAQNPVYAQVLEELRAERKRTHWMWFVFPQLAGLGHSAMAQRYSLASLDEARQYLAHPLLGGRLRACSRLVNEIENGTAEEIFGYPDNLKFRSCMTLFAAADPSEPAFEESLRKYFDGAGDPMTLDRLG